MYAHKILKTIELQVIVLHRNSSDLTQYALFNSSIKRYITQIWLHDLESRKLPTHLNESF